MASRKTAEKAKKDDKKPVIYSCLKHGAFIEVTANSPEEADGDEKVNHKSELIIEGSAPSVQVWPIGFRLPAGAHDGNETHLLKKGNLYSIVVHNFVAIDNATFVGKGEGKLFLFLAFSKNNVRFWVYRDSLYFTINKKEKGN
ncbi:MAG: hypothetical protein Q7S70_02380 [bacterium]|nr:hypothetical protein [bacterium]